MCTSWAGLVSRVCCHGLSMASVLFALLRDALLCRQLFVLVYKGVPTATAVYVYALSAFAAL